VIKPKWKINVPDSIKGLSEYPGACPQLLLGIKTARSLLHLYPVDLKIVGAFSMLTAMLERRILQKVIYVFQF
jgi:hypothetical protein